MSLNSKQIKFHKPNYNKKDTKESTYLLIMIKITFNHFLFNYKVAFKSLFKHFSFKMRISCFLRASKSPKKRTEIIK